MSMWHWQGDNVTWSAEGSKITQLVLDEYQVGFWLAAAQWSILVTLEHAFDWHDGSLLVRVDPQSRQGIERLVPALGRRVESLRIDEPGYLALMLEGGLALNAPPAEAYESWNLCGTGRLEGLRYVAAPGGITRWEPAES